MTQDQHNPTPQSSESIDGSSSSDAPAKTAKSTGSARAPRRRHTPSRSRQPKEQANDQKDTKATTETQSQQDQQYQQAEQPSQQRPVAVAAPAAVENAPQVGAETGAETTAETATEPTQPAKSGQRASARGRRGGGSRRRGNKAEDVQLVPVVSAEQTATSISPTLSGELAGAATETQESPADDLPAPEPLPLDTAILAHLDALAQAAGATGQQEAASGEATSAPQDETPAQTRRYRFDRPRAQATTSATPPRTERLSGWRATPPTLMTTAPQAPTEAEAETVAVREAPASETEAITGESAPTESAERVEANAPVIAGGSPEATEGSEGSEGSEAPEVFEAGEAPADEEEAAGTEAASEDDEHAEHEGAGRRRRRRGRRSVRGQDAETGEIEGDEHHEQQGHTEPSPTAPTAPSSPSGRSRSRAPYAAPETVVTYGHDYDSGNNGNVLATEGFDEPGYSPYTPTPAPRTRASRSGQPAARHQAESEWSMSTAQEHMQEPASPFGAPEPSFARGFGPQSSGVAAPLHEPLPRIRRGERGGEAPPMSANQLGAVLTNSFAQQTDRLLNELRRQQYPPSMTVALPAFPSTERIGVFVDVANLLYSARNQRMSIDFGRLLDFLRGNRRLIRAHAYAPTNPDPHAEQTFLAAVKGVGYRITTKNYKTFASGARKADMDLDLCMDIVRLVDAGALDTVALVSGDSDFLPLLEYCSDHGVRVEVAAFDDAAAMILRQSCDLFINLSQVDEIRA